MDVPVLFCCYHNTQHLETRFLLLTSYHFVYIAYDPKQQASLTNPNFDLKSVSLVLCDDHWSLRKTSIDSYLDHSVIRTFFFSDSTTKGTGIKSPQLFHITSSQYLLTKLSEKMKPSSLCPFLRSKSCHFLSLILVILSIILMLQTTSAQVSTSVAKQTLGDRPAFIPCGELYEWVVESPSDSMNQTLEFAQLALGPNGLKLPGVKYFPCTLVRSMKYVSGHYKRGIRMLMKNHRKSLSRNKFLNSIGTRQKSQVMSSMATKIAGNVVARVASTFIKRKA